jgi:uncharacterized membrane protein YdjX (TVP38/TMEM64 family)
VTDAASRRWWHTIAAGVLWLGLIAGYQVWAIRSGTSPGEAGGRLVDAIDGTLGIAIFVVLYLLRPLVLFPATGLTVAAGFVFGPWLGLIVVILAANASALLTYAAGRWFGRPATTGTPGGGRMARYRARLHERTFETVLIMRLVLLPYDVVSYLAGVLRVAPLPFLAATAVGSIPGTVAFVLFGASIESFDGAVPSINPWTLVASVVLLGVSLILVRIVRRREDQSGGQ